MKKLLRYLISRDYLFTDSAILLYLALTKLLLHLLVSTNFGIHRDEFLYLAMGDHLEWGFRETPPAIAVWGNWLTSVFGNTVFAVRFLPAMLGSMMVLLVGGMTRQMGGGRFAMAISGIAVIIAPLFLRSGTLFQPVIFNQFYWTLASFLFVNIALQKRKWVWWICLGAICGLALLNKYTMLLWGSGLAIGLLFSEQRKQLLTPWPWIALAIAGIIFFPNIQWQQANSWPLFEHLQQLRTNQLSHVSKTGFIIDQILMLQPATFFIWPCGIVFFLYSKAGKPFRALGWIYVFSFIALLYLQGKAYYLGPAYPALFAGGAIYVERFILAKRMYWLKPVAVIYLLLSGVIFSPYGAPVLPVRYMEFYCQFMAENVGLDGPLKNETGKLGTLPQDYADMHGWKNQVNTVARVFHELTPEEQEQCVIWAGNYGQAGALDFYGPAQGLPAPISLNSSYYRWGAGEKPGNVVITIGIPFDELKKHFVKIRRRAMVNHRYAIYYEKDLPIFVCWTPETPLQDLWPTLKSYQ